MEYIGGRGVKYMEVRLATADDAENLFELNELFENSTTLELMKKSIAENDREVICIAYIDGAAAGFSTGSITRSICYSNARADIETLYVKEEYRSQGVGAALMSCLETTLISMGIYHFHLTTHSSNTKAQALYKKIGYTNSGEMLFEKTASLISFPP